VTSVLRTAKRILGQTPGQNTRAARIGRWIITLMALVTLGALAPACAGTDHTVRANTIRPDPALPDSTPRTAAPAIPKQGADRPLVRVAVAPVAGYRRPSVDLVRELTWADARETPSLPRMSVVVLDQEGPSDDSLTPPRALVEAATAAGADLLIWGSPTADGRLRLMLLHLYALDPAHHARQAAGSMPIVPLAHRLPDFSADRPVATVQAVRGVVFSRAGLPGASRQAMLTANQTPELTAEERYPLVFFMSLADLILGVNRNDGLQVDRALYGFNALRTLLDPATDTQLAGAVRLNRGVAMMMHPQRTGPAQYGLAIAALEEALPFFPAEHMPFVHARILHQIATVEQRLPDDRDGYHLHRAINAYRLALRLWDPERFPEAYRHALHNMGVCFQRLPVGDHTRNLLAAISLYRNALSTPLSQARPDLAATTWSNLGQAFHDLPLAPEDRNLHDAVTSYEQALLWWTRERGPAQYATLHQQIALSWEQMRSGDLRDNRLKALGHFDLALEAVSRQTDPVHYGLIQAKRGSLLAGLPSEDAPRALPMAHEALQQALTVLTPDNVPILYSHVVQNLQEVDRRLSAQESAEGPRPPAPTTNPEPANP